MMSANAKRAQPKRTQTVRPGSSCSGPALRVPNRTGPATAIVVGDTPYLVDFGAGVIRRAAAAYQKGVTAFGPDAANIATAFLTHLHSDHTMGYPDELAQIANTVRPGLLVTLSSLDRR